MYAFELEECTPLKLVRAGYSAFRPSSDLEAEVADSSRDSTWSLNFLRADLNSKLSLLNLVRHFTPCSQQSPYRLSYPSPTVLVLKIVYLQTYVHHQKKSSIVRRTSLLNRQSSDVLVNCQTNLVAYCMCS